MKITLLCLVSSVPFILCIMGGFDEGRERLSVVSIRNQDYIDEHICCGVIIAPKFVLTAATCVKDKDPRDLRIVAGISKLNDSDSEELEIKKIISKVPTGLNDVRNNIALLRLYHEVTESKIIYRVDLPAFEKDKDREGRSCDTLGWGQKDVSAGGGTVALYCR